MLQLIAKKNLLVYDYDTAVAEVEREITGVSVSHERGMDELSVKFISGQEELGELRMDVETAQMLLRAFDCMKVLDGTDSRAVSGMRQVPENPGMDPDEDGQR